MDRRHFLSATSAATLAAGTALAADKPSLKGPRIDLTTGKGNLDLMARLEGDLDESKVKYGGASGIVSGVRAGEKVRDLFGFEVWSVATTRKQSDGSYRILHRECVYYTDLATEQILTEWVNPYTNEKVKVV